ncbi:MAG: ATP-binding protein, partial [Chloroflexi bacterium]|nr:ATP-binding protein [Chloroflexota bacterium]
MLKLAIDAGLPLITVQTDDTVNVGRVLAAIANMPVTNYKPNLKPKIMPGHVYYVVPIENFDFAKAYIKFAGAQAVLIVVNPPIQHSAAFHAGVVVPPVSMIKDFVVEYGAKKHQLGLMAALAGLSFEQVFQVTKLAMAKHGEYTAKAVRDIRRTFFGSVRGLQMLSTDFLFYQPTLFLQDWLKTSGRFLTEFDVPLLTPRGLLFNGPPGTGKTMAAKYLARELGLPLYHLDIASLMNQYVGESENNLRIALKQAEQSAPYL